MAKQRTSKVKQLDSLEQTISKAAERTAEITGQAVTGQDSKKTFSIDDARPVKQSRQAQGITAKGRAKFTTMLRTDLREKLDNLARRNNISIADALELIVTEYLGIK
jgi:predicted amidohydrolase YtcJ